MTQCKPVNFDTDIKKLDITSHYFNNLLYPAIIWAQLTHSEIHQIIFLTVPNYIFWYIWGIFLVSFWYS